MTTGSDSISDERPLGRPSDLRILFLTRACLLDDSNGASVASRALVRALAGRGWPIEVLCGPMLDASEGVDVAAWLPGLGFDCEIAEGHGYSADARGIRADVPPHLRLVGGGVPVTVHRGRRRSGRRPRGSGTSSSGCSCCRPIACDCRSAIPRY